MSHAPGYAFRGPGLDRAEMLRENPARLAESWPGARVLLVDTEGNARFPGSAEAPEFPLGAQLFPELPEAASFLGLDGDTAWFALPHESLADPLPGRLDLRQAALQWPALDAAALAQARALLHWQQRSKYCGGCGGAVAIVRCGWCARCGQCGLEQYPRTDPAVIVAVSDGERLLLGRQAAWPTRRYSTIAGFVEPGESLEHTVAREVLEETGVRVKSCRYLASQPWPFPSSLMLGFVADAHPDQPRLSDELEDARWFTRDEVREAQAREADPSRDDGTGLLVSPRLSIARWLIDRWVEGAA